jgi:hypothetical protein
VRQRLGGQVKGFLSFGLISLAVAADKSGGRTVRGWHDWWVVVITSVLIVLLLAAIFRWRKLGLGLWKSIGLTVAGLAILWAGYGLAGLGLDYRFFLGVAVLMLALASSLSVAYLVSVRWKAREKWLKKRVGVLDGAASMAVTAAVSAGVIKGFAGVAGAGVNHLWGYLVLVVGLLVIFTFHVVPLFTKAEGQR